MPPPTPRQRRARARHLRLLARVQRHSRRWLEPATDRWFARRWTIGSARRRTAHRIAFWPNVRRVKGEYHRRNR